LRSSWIAITPPSVPMIDPAAVSLVPPSTTAVIAQSSNSIPSLGFTEPLPE
jgi:hypothetical protein